MSGFYKACRARVAELVDALASGASGGNTVQVQVLPRAPDHSKMVGERHFFCANDRGLGLFDSFL